LTWAILRDYSDSRWSIVELFSGNSQQIQNLRPRSWQFILKPGLFILVPFELGKERKYLEEPLLVAREIVGGKGYYFSHGAAMQIHQMLTQPQLLVYASVLNGCVPLHTVNFSDNSEETPIRH